MKREIAKKKREALEILGAVKIPISTYSPRKQERLALALLALSNIKPKSKWTEAFYWGDANRFGLTTKKIIEFWNAHYGEHISKGSYDDIKRKELATLLPASIAVGAMDADANTNNPTRAYAISQIFSPVLLTFGTDQWSMSVSTFLDSVGSFADRLERKRLQSKVPISLASGESLLLSPGPHNILQKAILEEFLPRFVKEAKVLYVGDSSKKILHYEREHLEELGFFELSHEALPDIVAVDTHNGWLFLIEAVHSSNPISKERHLMLEHLTANCTLPRVYVSVFQNRLTLRNWIAEISWETEVWLAESPDHMIHFNGDKFLGPHSSQ